MRRCDRFDARTDERTNEQTNLTRELVGNSGIRKILTARSQRPVGLTLGAGWERSMSTWVRAYTDTSQASSNSPPPPQNEALLPWALFIICLHFVCSKKKFAEWSIEEQQSSGIADVVVSSFRSVPRDGKQENLVRV